MIINLNELEMKVHPKFSGVRIGFIVTKEKHPELSITLLEIEPGVEIPLHSHEREVDTILVLSGEGEVFVEGGIYLVRSGDCVVIPPGAKHGVKNIGKGILRCYIVHAPALW